MREFTIGYGMAYFRMHSIRWPGQPCSRKIARSFRGYPCSVWWR
jgi:hypothetical protein